MNEFKKSMMGIQASEQLKKDTLSYVRMEREKRLSARPHYGFRTAAAVATCIVFLCLIGGYGVYNHPVSYISIDVNPSVELGINCFGKVVSAEAYNQDGKKILDRSSLKHSSYMQAIDELLELEVGEGYLAEKSLLVFTVISDDSDGVLNEIRSNHTWQTYDVLTYTSDESCMEEAHRQEMSFGKYRAYLELTEYNSDVTAEDCHHMTMKEIQGEIDRCRRHGQTEGGNQHRQGGSPQSYGGHGGHHGRYHGGS